MPMSRSEARVIDPVLSNVALGYTAVGNVGMLLFPRVEMPTSGAKVIRFGKESFFKYNLRRAPGANVVDIQFGHSSEPVGFVQDSFNAKVPREFLRETEHMPGLNLQSEAVGEGMLIAHRGLEYDQADLAQDAAQYDANHKVTLGTPWTNPAADVLGDVEAGIAAIRLSTGIEPNVLVIPYAAFKGAKKSTAVRENFKYTSAKSITAEMMAEYLGVEKVVVGKGTFATDETSDFTEVWTKAVLAYVPTVVTSARMPSYGYTYAGIGQPLVEEGFYHKDTKSWKYPVEYERKPYLTSMNAGYLLDGVQ